MGNIQIPPFVAASLPLVISDHPLFVVMSVYAVKASAIHLYYALEEMMDDHSYFDPKTMDFSQKGLQKIENLEGFQHLEEIVKTPGVDAVGLEPSISPRKWVYPAEPITPK
jgi:hypothetical protein